MREKYEISRKNPALQDKKIDKSIFLVFTIPVFLMKNKNLEFNEKFLDFLLNETFKH